MPGTILFLVPNAPRMLIGSCDPMLCPFRLSGFALCSRRQAVKVPVIEPPTTAASASAPERPIPPVATTAALDFGPKNPLLPLATVLAPANIRSMELLDYEKTRCGEIEIEMTPPTHTHTCSCSFSRSVPTPTAQPRTGEVLG